jgi:small subunit ribosomal protein S17
MKKSGKNKVTGKKVIIGEVLSAKMDKTIVVSIDRSKKHPIYLKSFNVSQKYYVHDEEKKAKKGDVVEIRESRPRSRLKRWQLVKIISKKI